MNTGLVWLGLLVPLTSLAEDGVLESGAGAQDKRIRTTVSLSTSVGQATFVGDDNADNPTVGQSLSLGPGYSLTDKLSVGLGWSLGWEYTNPDNDTGRRYSPSDLSGSLSHSELWGHEGAGLRLSGSLRAIAPTSYESRASNTITNLTASLLLSKAFGKKLSASYGVGFTKFFATTTYRGQTGSQYDSDGIPLCLDSEREGGGCQGGLNSNFAISHNLGAGYSFTDKLSGSLGFGVRQRFKNTPEGGSWTRQHSESTEGSVSVSYALNDTYSLSAGISSGQPALDGRNSRPRFPMFDFETPANGFTTFGVTLSGRF